MYVVTADQRGSRKNPDAVPDALAALDSAYSDDLVLTFERTAGDEVQGLARDADLVVRIVADLVRRGGWWIGVGVGAAETPLPDSVRAGRGPAFVHARDAVERAKQYPTATAVTADDARAAERAETALWLLAGLLQRRSDAGWEAVDAMSEVERQADAAARLGITPQAMSRRLRVAGWAEEKRGHLLAAWVLEQGDVR
ncbi:MAG: hypothetical protein L0K86_25665 [Actinomycetia bacterium]|nr:hypothetical protein [Actinomycetes bacterium]